MVQQTILEYQPVTLPFVGSSSLGVENFTHGPHEILFRGPQILDQSVESRVFPLSPLPVYHLKGSVFDWAG